MGQWFARLLLEEGHEVLLVGRRAEKLHRVQASLPVEVTTEMDRVAGSDVIIISVPPQAFEGVTAEVGRHTRRGQVVTDLTSLKLAPVEAMHRHVREATVLGMHPVFGPGAPGLSNQNFVLTPTSEDERRLADRVKQYLEERGAHVSLMSPAEHDEVMTVVLGLAHFIAITAADVLLHEKHFQAMKAVGGTTFKVLYTLVESVISEDPELYAWLQMSFPALPGKEGHFVATAAAWAELVKRGDHRAFVERMAELQKILEQTDPQFQQAYRDMYRITGEL